MNSYANYVPQLGHAATTGFGAQYGAADLGHAYDTSRHTGSNWYGPSSDPASRFNEYACKYTYVLRYKRIALRNQRAPRFYNFFVDYFSRKFGEIIG